MARYLIGMTGASGSIFAVDLLKRLPGDKYLVMSDWARQVLASETGMKPGDLALLVKKTFADTDLAAPFSSGSNRHDGFIITPCSISTVGKIAAGIADTLITRAAAVCLKERMRLVLCVRETPLSTITLESLARLSREGVIVMPVSPPWYQKPRDLHALVADFTHKVLAVLGEEVPDTSGNAGRAWREQDLE